MRIRCAIKLEGGFQTYLKIGASLEEMRQSWATIMVARQVAYAGQQAILFSSVLPLMFISSFSFFRFLISDVGWQIVTKLYHMFGSDPNLQMSLGNLRVLLSKFDGRDFGQLRDLFANVSHI